MNCPRCGGRIHGAISEDGRRWALCADCLRETEGLEARPQCHACGATRGLVVCRVCGQVVCQEHARLHRHEK